MPADKKMQKENVPRPEKHDHKEYRDEQEEKARMEKLKAKNRRVNYIIKDLPIY